MNTKDLEFWNNTTTWAGIGLTIISLLKEEYRMIGWVFLIMFIILFIERNKSENIEEMKEEISKLKENLDIHKDLINIKAQILSIKGERK